MLWKYRCVPKIGFRSQRMRTRIRECLLRDSLAFKSRFTQGAPNPYFYRCKFSVCIKHDLKFDFSGKPRRIFKGPLRTATRMLWEYRCVPKIGFWSQRMRTRILECLLRDSLAFKSRFTQGAPNPYFYRCKFSVSIKHDLKFDFSGKTRRIFKGPSRSAAGWR